METEQLARLIERSERMFSGFIRGREEGGFVGLDRQWHDMPGGPVVETTEDDPVAEAWHDLVKMSCDNEAGEVSLHTVRYFKPA